MTVSSIKSIDGIEGWRPQKINKSGSEKRRVKHTVLKKKHIIVPN